MKGVIYVQETQYVFKNDGHACMTGCGGDI